MGYIQYSTFSFSKPSILSEEQYLGLKQKLNQDITYSFLDKDETFTNQFSDLFKKIILGGVGGAILICIGAAYFDGTFLLPIFMIGGLIGFFGYFIGGLFALFLSGPSYARYLVKKRNYFEKLKSSIIKSQNYSEFLNLMKN